MSLPHGYQFLHLAQTDSSNEQARRMAADGVSQPHWILADEQTAGRGRRGRHWHSPRGNLMTTLYLPTAFLPEHAGRLAFVAGLALAATVRDHSDKTHQVSLKWPNDVLLNGEKISGILLESSSAKGGHLAWLAIGIGLNIMAYPKDTPYPATSLKAMTGKAPPPLAVLENLAAHFEQLLQAQKTKGFAHILRQWRDLAHNLGAPVSVRLESKTLEGIFEDIDETGALILREANGRKESIAAGDIFFPDVVTYA